MVIEILYSFFPIIAILPLMFLLLSYGEEKKSELSFYGFIAVSVLYFFWEGFGPILLKAFADDSLWIRIGDAFFLFGFLSWAYKMENKDSKTFLWSAFPMFLLSSAFQIYFLKRSEPIFFGSILSAVFLGVYYDRLYVRYSYYPQVRTRLAFFAWILAVLLVLPVFRFIFLFQITYSFYRYHRSVIIAKNNRIKQYDLEHAKNHEIIENMMVALHDFSDLKIAVGRFLKSLCEGIEAKSAALYIWDEKSKSYRCIETYGYFFPLLSGAEQNFVHKESLHEIALSQKISEPDNLIWECGASRQGVFIPYAAQDERVSSLGGRASNIKTLLLEPLVFGKELLGVVVLENKLQERYFSQTDVYLLRNSSHYCSIIIEANRSAAEKEHQVMAQMELQLAYKIQSGLLPAQIPEFPGLELSASMSPAKDVGGDYYDFIPLGKEQLGIVIGDVSGSGVPAGMVMVYLQALLHAECLHYVDSYRTLVNINPQLSARISREAMFVTLLFFEWNAERRELSYTSCGHEHILHYKANENRLDVIRSGGIALAIVEDNSSLIRREILSVSPGDTVLLYTDGVTEAQNINNEMFGLERLKSFLNQHQGNSAKVIHDELLEKLQTFRAGALQTDDITVVVMRF
ncbi:MAG: SpoIIE family protein phosphatase [Fibrobacter sp.]|jgi:serine phosphatase RsbU (regulator of sigma subunit)|nr:SpoIIE family protein phosphatase [Fibrobacter sp.]